MLDTHTAIWAVTDDLGLSTRSRELIEDPSNELWLSVACVWEMSVKQGLRKLGPQTAIEAVVNTVLPRGVRLLSIDLPHVLAVRSLPPHHGDPFDRLLVVQAQTEGLTLVSRDAALDPYGVPRVW